MSQPNSDMENTVKYGMVTLTCVANVNALLGITDGVPSNVNDCIASSNLKTCTHTCLCEFDSSFLAQVSVNSVLFLRSPTQ